jgi:hypothetical protein
VFADQKLKDPVRVSRLRHGIVRELNFWFKQKKMIWRACRDAIRNGNRQHGLCGMFPRNPTWALAASGKPQ